MRVAIVSGSWPPTICGVGDYSAKLLESLRAAGVEAIAIESDDWAWSRRARIARAIAQLEPDVIHIQYPTWGYGPSRIPAWLVCKWRRRALITLHEYTAQVGPPLVRVLPRGLPHYWPFSLAGALVFTCDRERWSYLKIAPWARKRTHVVGIASNIPRANVSERRNVLTYFGQIAPNKGLEDFIATVARLRESQSGVAAEVVGGVPPRVADYAEGMMAMLRGQGVAVIRDAPPAEVAERLATSAYVFLPFPDGASEKRGSLLAALENRALVLTYHRAATPSWLRESTVGVIDAADAALNVLRYERNPELAEAHRCRVRPVGFDWPAIADAHVALYAQTLESAA